MVYSSSIEHPPRVSTTAYSIRRKALDLLEQSNPEHEIVFCYGPEQEDHLWDPLEPISYQHCPDFPDRDRDMYRVKRSHILQNDATQWVGALLPAMSFVSSACRAGISEIAKHTSEGIQKVQNEVKNRTAVPHSQPFRCTCEVRDVPGHETKTVVRKENHQSACEDKEVPDYGTTTAAGKKNRQSAREKKSRQSTCEVREVPDYGTTTTVGTKAHRSLGDRAEAQHGTSTSGQQPSDREKAQHATTTGQKTSEASLREIQDANDDLYRLDPADWAPLGFLFVPAGEAEKLGCTDDDMSDLTEWSVGFCPRICPIE
eukprot:scaffold2441_cov105-Cylindrotheca_fusiformis.AAC.7